jgi:hypothetical protein
MTFIAAFRGIDSVIFGADTQETVALTKYNYCEKLKVVDLPWGALVIGGAGNGDLCDGFFQAVEDETATFTPSSMGDVQEKLKRVLKMFCEKEVIYAQPKNRHFKFVIGASLVGRSVELWKTAGSRLIKIPNYGIIGWDAPIYKYFAERLKNFHAYPSEAVLAISYLLGIAKETGEGVGGENKIIVLRYGYAVEEPKAHVDSVVGRLADFNETLDRLFFTSMNLSIDENGFKQTMKLTEDYLLLLRRKHQNEVARILVEQQDMAKYYLYPRLPLTTRIFFTSIVFPKTLGFVTPPSKPGEQGSIPTRLTFEA